MRWNKVTVGFAIQTYEDNICVEQEFIAGDQVDYEGFYDGEPIDPPSHQSQDFGMIQPYPGGSQNAPSVTL